VIRLLLTSLGRIVAFLGGVPSCVLTAQHTSSTVRLSISSQSLVRESDSERTVPGLVPDRIVLKELTIEGLAAQDLRAYLPAAPA
jgi:hypothetical protein